MPQNQIHFGLRPVLDAVRELSRTVLPLKSVRYHFVVRGGTAEVEMTQVYCQENAEALDCEYLFPLPADGAVYRCEAIINGRVIRARVEERETARNIVAEKKAQGHRTALVESERDNLFTLSLGNIQPQDVVEVKLGYLQPLRRLAGQVALDLPLCPGVRYIPGRSLLRSNRGSGLVDDTDQVPDASRITPPRIDAEHPDAAFVELDGQLEAEFLDGEVHSPSHPLAAKRNGDMLLLTLAQGGEVPDRDLALRWQERNAAQTALRGWTRRDRGDDYALLELRAPASLESSDPVAQDVYFLVDRSGSMQGEKWQKAVQALHGCIEVLNPKDRVAVTLFESTFKDFDSEPASPAVLLADDRFRKLADLGAAGGTELEPALRHVLGQVERFSKDRPAVLVLLTDAQIGNEREIVALMRQHPSLPVHCFGIDTTLNDSLLLDLVRQQGGTFLALQPKEDVAAIVTQLGRTLGQPVLMNLQVPAGWDLAAGAIPNLYAGQIHLVSIRSKAGAEPNGLKVLARDHRNAPVTLEFKLAAIKESAPRLRWCKERLVALGAQDDKSAAILLSKEANLLCPFTAFLAWDEHEKVAVASHRLVQPALAPEYAAGAKMRRKFCASPSSAFAEPMFMDRVFASAPPPLRDKVENRKLVLLQERLRDFLSTLGLATGSKDWTKALLDLQDWLEQRADPDAVDLLAGLLDDCERSWNEWIHCEQRLQEIIPKLAAELEQAASNLRNSWLQRPDDRLRRFQEALSQTFLGTKREEIDETIAQMARIEAEILRRIEDFLRQHPHPSTPAPAPPRRKRWFA